MSHADSTRARPHGTLPWPTGWAHRTRGPQYRPAVIGGAVCVLFAVTLALDNPADGALLLVFAGGIFVYALRPALRYPIQVTLAQAPVGDAGAQFPLRLTGPLDLLRRRPTVTLTPSAVVADHGAPLVIPWSQITEVRAGEARTGIPYTLLPAPRLNWLTIGVADPDALAGGTRFRRRTARRFGDSAVTGFATTSLLSDPVVLFHTLHFYLDNPHARAELADTTAITRIRQARVDPTDQ